MKRAIIMIAVMALLGGGLSAQQLGTSGADGPPGSWDPGINVIKQHNTNDLVALSGISCVGGGVTTDTTILRRFDLDDDHNINFEFTVDSVWIGVEVCNPGAFNSQDVTIRTLRIPSAAPFTFGNMDLLDTTVIQCTAGDDLSVIGPIPIGGTINNPGSQDLVVSIWTPDNQENGSQGAFFFGGNGNGEIGDTYIAADDCGIFDPLALTELDFFENHWVMGVRGFEAPVELEHFIVD